MIHPDDPDDVEDGEELFEEVSEDGQDAYDRLQELRFYDELDMNTPRKSDGFAPADFIYDPFRELSRDEE